jgi:hypothetical protein
MKVGLGVGIRVNIRPVLVSVLLLAGLFVPIAAGAIVTAQPAGAYGPCSTYPFESNYFDGMVLHLAADATVGTAATIVQRGAYPCSGSTHDEQESAWDMIAGSGSNQYAQAGERRDDGCTTGCNGAVRQYVEYNNGTPGSQCNVQVESYVCEQAFGSGVANGENDLYFVEYYTGGPWPSCELGCEALIWCQGLSTCEAGEVTPFNPVFGSYPGYAGWTEPFSNQYLGEDYNVYSDIPGGPNGGWVTYQEMQVKATGSNNPPWTGYDNSFPSGDEAYTPTGVTPNNPRSNHDTVVNHGGTVGNAMDIYCATNGVPSYPACYD